MKIDIFMKFLTNDKKVLFALVVGSILALTSAGLVILSASGTKSSTSNTQQAEDTYHIKEAKGFSDGFVQKVIAQGYIDYAPDKLTNEKNIIFFKAEWCSSCNDANEQIEDHIDEIPQNVTILKADYDRETALKQKYGVTVQHTFVQVDNSGNMLGKWVGSYTLSEILANLK